MIDHCVIKIIRTRGWVYICFRFQNVQHEPCERNITKNPRLLVETTIDRR